MRLGLDAFALMASRPGFKRNLPTRSTSATPRRGYRTPPGRRCIPRYLASRRGWRPAGPGRYRKQSDGTTPIYLYSIDSISSA
jgi:hypothetical protein